MSSTRTRRTCWKRRKLFWERYPKYSEKIDYTTPRAAGFCCLYDGDLEDGAYG